MLLKKLRALFSFRASWPNKIQQHPQAKRWSHVKSADPSAGGLRILFCGSDDFSARSLEKIAGKKAHEDGIVNSIDVVCKKGRPYGRGLKRIRHVPVKAAAESLSLPLHEIDTFTGWSPPKPIDLIIAVSFGLKVPPRLLNYASFGGINLHPSLLPDLRGPAPLQHTLLAGRTSSGITLQTLHPEHFDQGSVLAQSYFRLPNDGLCTIDELRHFVAPRAADLLLSSLRDGSFMSRGRAQIHDGARDLIHASKVTPSMAHVNWDSWSSEQILRTQRALGGVWSFFKSEPSDSPRRIQWHDLHQVSLEREDFRNASCMTAQGRLFIARAKVTETTQSPVAKSRVVLRTCDGDYVSPFSITIEGKLRCLQPVQVIKEMPLMSLS